ncbi:MAG: Coenzyme F420 hydrogenase/dehydrogenase, beta subunit C-terminal domain, partial [Rectinemataceae bacterium]
MKVIGDIHSKESKDTSVNIQGTIETVISNGYCIGCGACASVTNSSYVIEFDMEGKYQAVYQDQTASQLEILSSVCPFANQSSNEDIIGKYLFGSIPHIKHDKYLGYYLKTYAGSVSLDAYRERGSSGGFGSWLSVALLEEGLIDFIIHVRPSTGSSHLFSYAISSSKEEIKQGAKSKYYPVEMSKMLEIVRNIPGRYLLIGVPCFIKAAYLLSEQEPIFKERIVYTLGLVCGHLKTDRFSKIIGWELGVHPDKLKFIDFRVKLPNSTANSYGVAVSGKEQDEVIISPMKQTIVSNWGHGLFRYIACDYCDDVLAETADITIGDAWLPEYVKDGQGTNIIVVRNSMIQEIIERRISELSIEEISAEKVYQSQAGGFHHRREGLSYRLFLKDQKKEWRPQKRVEPSSAIPKRRKRIYKQRTPLLYIANEAYGRALRA